MEIYNPYECSLIVAKFLTGRATLLDIIKIRKLLSSGKTKYKPTFLDIVIIVFLQ